MVVGLSSRGDTDLARRRLSLDYDLLRRWPGRDSGYLRLNRLDNQQREYVVISDTATLREHTRGRGLCFSELLLRRGHAREQRHRTSIHRTCFRDKRWRYLVIERFCPWGGVDKCRVSECHHLRSRRNRPD